MKKLSNYFSISSMKNYMKDKIRNLIIDVILADEDKNTNSDVVDLVGADDPTPVTQSNKLDEINTQVFDWVTDRISVLKKTENFGELDNATALEEEFSEWISSYEDDSEIDCMYWEFMGLDKSENL